MQNFILAAENSAKMQWRGIDAFLDTLPIMGVGMLGIFLVTGIIIGSVYLLGLIKKGDK